MSLNIYLPVKEKTLIMNYLKLGLDDKMLLNSPARLPELAQTAIMYMLGKYAVSWVPIGSSILITQSNRKCVYISKWKSADSRKRLYWKGVGGRQLQSSNG